MEVIQLAQQPFSPFANMVGAVNGRNECMNKLQPMIDEQRTAAAKKVDEDDEAFEYDWFAIRMFGLVWVIGGLMFYWCIYHLDDFLDFYLFEGPHSKDHHGDEL